MLKLESLDTNVIVELIMYRSDKNFERAYKLINTPRSYFYIPDLVFFEAEYILSKKYNMPRKQIIQSFKCLSNLQRLDYHHEFFFPVFDNYLKHPKLSFANCYFTAKMSDLNRTPFWTFDEKLAKQLPAASLVPELA